MTRTFRCAACGRGFASPAGRSIHRGKMHRLPTNPDELLTDEQHEALRRDLSKMAEQRRRSEAEARDLPMAAVSDEDGSTEGTE